jgi:hypothetical protein
LSAPRVPLEHDDLAIPCWQVSTQSKLVGSSGASRGSSHTCDHTCARSVRSCKPCVASRRAACNVYQTNNMLRGSCARYVVNGIRGRAKRQAWRSTHSMAGAHTQSRRVEQPEHSDGRHRHLKLVQTCPRDACAHKYAVAASKPRPLLRVSCPWARGYHG